MHHAYLRPGEAMHLHSSSVIRALPGLAPHTALNLHPQDLGRTSKVGAQNESIFIHMLQVPDL
eukprot:5943376-Amphidinium_carterae.1